LNEPLVTRNVGWKALLGLAELSAILGVAIFVTAGTMRFAEAWVFLALFVGASAAVTLYLLRNDRELLARRTKAGPLAEATSRQKLIQSLAGLVFLSTLVLPALARRFHWWRLPVALVALGDLLVAVGFSIVFRVFRENTFTSGTIQVAAQQRVVDTGPYAVVRHPMYAGALVLVAGIPLALGSLVGLVALPPFVAVLVWRLIEEERVLLKELTGYAEYREKTRYRLLPRIW
jgi:protein-S-isoprenylcysteine O-methyltransferase Ste14